MRRDSPSGKGYLLMIDETKYAPLDSGTRGKQRENFSLQMAGVPQTGHMFQPIIVLNRLS